MQKDMQQAKFEALTAAEITESALIQLKYRGWECWRQNQIPVRGRNFIGKEGLSDIIGFHKFTGLMLMCEVKTQKDILSANQKALLTQLKLAGGIALLALDDKKGGVIISEYQP